MRESLKNIVNNIVIIYSVELIIRVLQFSLIIFAARVLRVALFGDFSYVLTLYLLLQLLADFGFSVLLTKEVAQSPEKRDDVFRIALHLRVAAGCLLFLLFMTILYVLNDAADIKFFFLISGASVIISSYAQNFILTLRGLNLMKMDGLIRVTGAFVTTTAGLSALRAGTGIRGLAVALFLGNAAMVVAALLVNRKYGIIRASVLSPVKRDYLQMVRRTLPFMAMIISSNIFSRADTLLLQHMKGPMEVGLYNASMRVIEGLLIFQAAFAIVLFPVLSRHAAEENFNALKDIVHLAIKYMAFGGIFLAVTTVMTADKIIEILYFSKDYNAAIPALQILSAVVLLLYLSTPIGYLILSSRHAHVVAWFQLFMVLFNIGMNLVVIPSYGFAGAGVVRAATELFGLTLSVMFINKYLFRLSFLLELVKPLIAGLVVALIIYFAKSLLFLPLYFISYVLLLYLFGAISSKEFFFMRDILVERFQKT